jgi:hypothetical protein
MLPQAIHPVTLVTLNFGIVWCAKSLGVTLRPPVKPAPALIAGSGCREPSLTVGAYDLRREVSALRASIRDAETLSCGG